MIITAIKRLPSCAERDVGTAYELFTVANATRAASFLDTSDWQHPPIAFTLNLKQRYSEGNRSAAVWSWKIVPTGIFLSEHQFQAAIVDCLNRLDRKIYKNAHKRSGKRLRRIVVLEKGTDGRWHAHLLVEPPTGLAVEQFKTLIEKCWQQTDLARGHDAKTADYPGGWTSYMTKLRGKDGLECWSDALCLDAIHNPRQNLLPDKHYAVP